ncbi:MAG: hypothetical protein HYT87_20310 [Nitrospirae bacterium]|nr:hypothetical protein [Nitrospirota bacterium]
MTLLEGTEGKVRFRVIVSGVKEGSGGVTASSEPFVIRSLRLWTEEEERQADAIDEQADSTYFELKAKFGHEEAAQRTVEWLKMQPGVASAGASEGGYSFLMESGIQGGYLETIPRKNANPADLKPDLQKEGFEEHCLGDVCDTPDPTAAPASAVRKLAPLQYKMDRRGGLRAGITNPKVLIASPFAGELPVKASVELNRMFGSHRCPIFDRRWIVGEKAGVETFKTMKDYDIIVLDTHGDAICWKAEGGYERCRRGDLPPPGAIVITRTGTPVTKEMSRLYSEERRSGLIVGDRLFSTYAITPAFVYKHKPFRQKSMVYNLSCRSLYNHTMAQAFRNVGVSPYFGYSEYVDTCYDDIVPTIFQSLLKGHTAGRAYSDGVAAYGPTDASCSPVPEPHPATLILAGSSDLKITIEGFNNGSFEQGPGTPPPGWDAKGDVQIITQLGPITAKEGIYMAYLSTGENAEDQSKSALEQPFCVPADKSKISFSYRLVSEEPDEFLNSGYRDTFEAALVIGTARTVLVSETTDKGPWSPLPGVDLEGGDRTAFATDWKTVASELSETARAEGATLAFRLQDNGDLVYDTVALLDNVHLE